MFTQKGAGRGAGKRGAGWGCGVGWVGGGDTNEIENIKKTDHTQKLLRSVFDCFSDWPSFVKQRAFSRISAYGVLSICRDPAHYRNAVARIADSLPKGGVFIGADWIRHAKYKQAEDGSDTSFLNQGLIHEALTKGQLRIRELETLSIVGDALYGQIIHWVAEKP